MYDNGSEFVFAQTGIRRIDERSTLNVGVGIRLFSAEAWMLGSNVFFDNDLTGSNARLGVGLEAWTDSLKLAGNFYHGLTDWHQSKDFIDYDERPADGFDLRAEAFLPSLPQLGGKLVFEQYFGDEVALFGNGETDRQKDPHAVTAALTYSPFPLLATTVEHRIGSAGQNETSLNLGGNYQIGVPLGMQINPERLSEMRNLVGSKFDLVDRNNQIVLEYKKQDIITASLPPSVEGNSQGEVIVKVDVNSRYGLKEVNWDAAALLSAGGSLDIVGIDQVRVTLPPYQSSVSRDGYDPNRYTLGAVVYDTRGNASERVTTILVVSQSTGAQINASDLTVTTDGAVANGTATNAVQAVLKNASGELLSGQSVTFTASNGASVTAVIGTTGADGIATATLTNTTAGVSAVTATLANSASQSVDTTFVAGAAPVATDVAIDNSRPIEGETLTGSYVFGDVDGDVEGTSTFKWYRNGVEITGETAKTYVLVAEDRGKAIKFEVTPMSATGIPKGEPAQSAESLVAGCSRRLETAGALSYTCPLTVAEAKANGISYQSTWLVNGVVFVRHDWNSATAYCTSLGGGIDYQPVMN